MSTSALCETSLLHAEPQLFVTDLEAALRFYGGQLGFSVAFSHGEPPFYAQIRRGGVRLNLRHADRPALDPDFVRAETDPLAATIAVDRAGPLYAELERNGVEFRQPLRAEPWGAETFIVRDPDGNLLCFAGSTD